MISADSRDPSIRSLICTLALGAFVAALDHAWGAAAVGERISSAPSCSAADRCASKERLAPILMTTLAAGLALVPLLLTGDKPGQEIEYPMAIVIMGGLLTATVQNLFVVPSLYLRAARARKRRKRSPRRPQRGPDPRYGSRFDITTRSTRYESPSTASSRMRPIPGA